jgi:spectinomycin phosphotransferase
MQPMLEKPDIAEEQISEHVRDSYALSVRRAEFLGLGADVSAAVYRIACTEGAYFLKLRRGAPRPRVELARFLADTGRTEVLAPLRAQNGRLSTRIGDFSVTVYPFVEGKNGFEAPLTNDQWTRFGAALRAVHDVELPATLRDAVVVDAYAPTWRNNVRARLAIGVPRGQGDAITRELAELLASKQAAIASLVEHAEELATVLQARSPAVVPCHGDLHAGNVLLASNGSLTIVDWDHPVLAPRERDLMFIGGGVGGAWKKPNESTAFFRGYGHTAVNVEALAYYRCERILEDVASYSDQLLQDVDRPADHPIALRRFRSQFGANDVVEIAERTFAEL